MPKINVYLPDELADSVKETGLPVSAICQRALEQSVKRVTAIRAVSDLSDADPTAGLTSFTERARNALKLAIAAAKDRGADEVGTRDLLVGMLSEGENLGVRLLQVNEVDPAHALREARELLSTPENGRASRMGVTAANALELTVMEALSLGHNYVGCEHLLLGLLAEPDGAGGELLRGLGVELRQVRRTATAVLAGFVHLRAKQGGDEITTAVRKALEPVLRRLDRLEESAGLTT